ncbi:MAG: zinc-binding dehydrogenase [SAR202 cluster bacterium]|nr:zinc-binding dehydrogenase [SAR202 cluster bacterium]
MVKMAAAILRGLGEIECDEVDLPDSSADKVLVKMEMASICGTDLHYVFHGWPRNKYPMSPGEPGHEGIGRVVDPGPTQLEEGALVLTVPNIWEARNFAGFQWISPNFLLELPNGRPPAELMMAQQLGTVIFAAQKLPSLVGKTAVVIGQGSAGLFHDYYLRKLGAARIIAIEPNVDRRNAGINLKVDHAIDVTGQSAIDAVLDITEGEGAEVIIDAVGGGDTLDQAIKIVKAEGHVHVFGLPTGFDKIPFDLGTYFLKRLDMRTIFGAQDEDNLSSFRKALDLIVDGDIDMSPYVTHALPIASVKEAFALAHEPSGGALKVSITM